MHAGSCQPDRLTRKQLGRKGSGVLADKKLSVSQPSAYAVKANCEAFRIFTDTTVWSW